MRAYPLRGMMPYTYDSYHWLSCLNSLLQMEVVLRIAEKEKLSFEDAFLKFLEEYSDAFNFIPDEQRGF